MTVLGRWNDWKCPRCDSVNGPKTGLLCDVCASDGEHGEVVELVRADAYQGAVSRIATALIEAAQDPVAWGFMDLEESDRAALGRLIDAALRSRA